MEIERQFLLKEIPNLPWVEHFNIEQIYLSTSPEVRVRKKIIAKDFVNIDRPHNPYTLTIKGEGSLAREEIETPVNIIFWEDCLKLIGNKNPIKKDYYVFEVDGYRLEVSKVDNDFIYAEIEFSSIEEAKAYHPSFEYEEEITYQDDWKLKNYWLNSR